jgi:hypothetical protein
VTTAALQDLRAVCTDAGLRRVLETQRDEALRTLTHATELNMVHRAQGIYLSAQGLLDMLEKAKGLR